MKTKPSVKVLALNCGSSSVKFQLLETDGSRAARSDLVLAKGLLENIGGTALLRLEAQGRKPVKETAEILDHRVAVERALQFLTHPAGGVIADRREIYNEAVNNNNVRIEQFPDAILARLFNFKTFELFL